MPTNNDRYWNQYAEVWNDLVRIRDLALANVLGIVSGIIFYVISWYFLSHQGWAAPEKVRGYALFFGILGCLLSGWLSTRWFKAKRELVIGERSGFHEALIQMGVDPEKEMAAIKASPADNQRELGELGIMVDCGKE